MQISEKLQLSIYVDEIKINLSRNIEIGAVYGTIKDEDAETIFRDLSKDPDKDASVARDSSADRPISRGDSEAEQQYKDIRQKIFSTCPVEKARTQVRESRHGDKQDSLSNAQMRAAMCGKLVGSPAVPHTPTKSIRVSTLQNLLPAWLARFLARLPFLLRLFLLPLSYLHPITISSITVGGPGYWLADIVQKQILDHYLQDTDEGKDLSTRLNDWLKDAMFTLDFTRISALGQVPVRTMHDVVAELRGADATVFRAAPDEVEWLMEFGGADMEFVIPSYLLPHHEHLVPAKPGAQSREIKQEGSSGSEGQSNNENDMADISMRIHGSLPAATDHSLIEFIVDLVNASRVLEIEAADDDEDNEEQSTNDGQSAQQEKPGLRDRAKGLLREHVKDRGKQLAMRGLGNQQSEWVKTMVRNAASQLERMHGDVGYTGSIPVALQPYRASSDLPPKLWP